MAVAGEYMALGLGCAFVVSCAITRIVLSATRRWGLLDQPNARSAHQLPTPTAGGLGIVAGFWSAVAVVVWSGSWSGEGVAGLLGATALLLLVIIDDLVRPMQPWEKIILLLLAIGAWLGLGPRLEWLTLPGIGLVGLGIWGLPLTVLWFFFLCNAFNFMDGIDGLSALQTLCACCWLGLLLWGVGSPTAALAWILAAGASGFLVFNIPPARIFMGDVGAIFSGFAIAAFSIIGERAGLPLWVFCAVLAVYFFDVCYTLVRRLLRGENLLQAHRKHLYQRLDKLGWSHWRIDAGVVCITSIMSIGAYRHMAGASGIIFFLLGTGALIAVAVWIEIRDPEFG